MGGSSKPKPAPILPEAPVMPDVESSVSATDKGRWKAGRQNLLTGPGGLNTPAPTAPKTLLGA